MQKFLIIQTAFIGDVVLATALIEKLHFSFPDIKIDFLLRKGNEGLLVHHPYLNQLLIWDKKRRKYLHLLSLALQIRKRKYDVVINVQRFAATGLLTAVSGATHKIGFNKNPLSFLFTQKVQHQISTKNNYLHEVDRNQLLIKDITDEHAAKPRLYPSPADFEFVKKYQAITYICIAPASVWFTKQYPKTKWITLINKLPDTVAIFLLGAPTDKSLCEEIRNACKEKKIENLAGKLNFLQSAALQQKAMMNYVNDSAPLHFASSVNAPVTAVYCSTVPSFGFGPLSDNKHIIETLLPLDCKPCGLHGHKQCPKGHYKCALSITDEQLLSVLP